MLEKDGSFPVWNFLISQALRWTHSQTCLTSSQQPCSTGLLALPGALTGVLPHL